MNRTLYFNTKWLVAFLLSSGMFLNAHADVYLSTHFNNGIPDNQNQNTFNCREKIYGVIVGQWPAGTEHQMEAFWTDPQGKQREHTQYTFTARNGKTHTWAWLQLHQGKSDMLDKLLMQENDSLRAFSGQWKVDFYVDDKKLGKLTFILNCG